MPLETEKEDESELEAIGVVIQSGKLSTEEVGFGLREFEPTPRLEGHQVGGEEPPRSPPEPPGVCPTLTYSTFAVQIRIHGTVTFYHCEDPDCDIPGAPETVSVDFTVNLTDMGGGVAQYYDDPSSGYSCAGNPDNLFFDARLICCTPPLPTFPCSICWQPDYQWQIRLFMNAFFCKSYANVDCYPFPNRAVTQAIIFDTNCVFNATYGTVQLDTTPVPNGFYSGTTSMTEQGGSYGVCDPRPAVNQSGENVGDLVIDWSFNIAP